MTTVAAVYLRQSLDRDGNELGIARQREDCLKLAADKGWKAQEYVDNDTSASTGKVRPAYERMLSDIRDGYIGAVVAWDLDRLHRRPIELESFMALADAEQIKLATVSGDEAWHTFNLSLVEPFATMIAANPDLRGCFVAIRVWGYDNISYPCVCQIGSTDYFNKAPDEYSVIFPIIAQTGSYPDDPMGYVCCLLRWAADYTIRIKVYDQVVGHTPGIGFRFDAVIVSIPEDYGALTHSHDI